MFRSVHHRSRGIDGRYLERELGPAESCQIGGQDQEIRGSAEGRERPGEEQREVVALRRRGIGVLQLAHLVLEPEESPWVDLEGKVEIDGAVTRFFGMEIDFPHLPQRIRFDEMAFIVDVESMVHGMTLEMGHETGHIDERHGTSRSDWTDTTLRRVNPDALLDLLHRTADAVTKALEQVTDWGPSGRRTGQYGADIIADDAALAVLRRAGVGILSEESPPTDLDASIVVVVDPLDGSTNASRGVPHYATSLCAVDEDGPLVALVAHQARSTRWWAVRGRGAVRDGHPIAPSRCREWSSAIVALSGPPPREPGWWQYRTFGASAIDICLVADGTVDAFIDMSTDAHGVWDYAAGWLIGREAGIEVRDAFDRDLLALEWTTRRTPVAAPSALMASALEARSQAQL